MAELLTLSQMARRAGIPSAYLKDLAKAGKVPSLQVGGRFLFNSEATIAALANLAAEASVPDKGAERGPDNAK